MLEFGGFNVFFNVNRCKRNTLVSFHFDRGKFSCSFYPKVLPGFSIQKESALGNVTSTSLPGSTPLSTAILKAE